MTRLIEVGRYLINKGASEEGSRSKSSRYVLGFFLILLTIVIFYLLGQLQIDRTIVLTIIMLGCLVVGSVNGYVYLANYRIIEIVNSPKSLNLYLEILTSLFICKLFVLSTLMPLYISQGYPLTWLAVIKLGAIVVLMGVALCLIGNLIFLTIRRLSYNPFLRSLLVIGLAILLWRSVILWPTFFSRVNIILLGSNFQNTLILIFGLIGLVGFTLGALELLFYRQVIKPREIPKFWQLTFSNRALSLCFGPGMAIFSSELLRIVRNASWQRKLIFYWLLLAIMSGITRLFLAEEVSQERLTIFITVLSAVTAGLLVSYQSGQELSQQIKHLRRFPIKTSTHFFARFWASTLVTLAISFLFASFSFLSGVLNQPVNYLTFAILTLIIQIIFFSLAVIGQRHLNSYLFPVVLAIVFGLTLIPVIFYQVVPTLVTIAILGLWLTGLWLIVRTQVSKVLTDVG